MSNFFETIGYCVLFLWLGAVGAQWATGLFPNEWLPSFAFGSIAGFTICYILNCIKTNKKGTE